TQSAAEPRRPVALRVWPAQARRFYRPSRHGDEDAGRTLRQGVPENRGGLWVARAVSARLDLRTGTVDHVAQSWSGELRTVDRVRVSCLSPPGHNRLMFSCTHV